MAQTTDSHRSLGELFAELSRETSALVRSEMSLAKTELTEQVAQLGRHAAAVAVGGAVTYAGVLVLVAAMVLILAKLGLPSWGAAMIVGVVVAATGYAMVQNGLAALRRADVFPHQTINSVKETAQWAKKQTR